MSQINQSEIKDIIIEIQRMSLNEIKNVNNVGNIGGPSRINVKLGKILIFLKNDKNSKISQNGSGKPENFSKSWMMKQTSPFDSSHEI